MEDTFLAGTAPDSLATAKLVLPVLVYYASVLRKSLTYGELGYIVGRHQRVFRYPFGYIHRWLTMLQPSLGEIPPLPLLVFEKGRQSPTSGAVDWWLGVTGLKVETLSPLRKQEIMEGITQAICSYPKWSEILMKLDLPAYKPQL